MTPDAAAASIAVAAPDGKEGGMDILGLNVPSFAIAAAVACLLAVGLGIRTVRAWRRHGLSAEEHHTVAVTLMLSYACVYSAVAVMAIYILARGLFAYYLMDQFVTLLFSAGTISLTALLMTLIAGGRDLTRSQAQDSLFLLALPSAVTLLLMGWETLALVLAPILVP